MAWKNEIPYLKSWVASLIGSAAAVIAAAFLWRLTAIAIEGVIFWAFGAYVGGIAWACRLMDLPEGRRRRVFKGIFQMVICGAAAGLILVPLGMPAIELFIVTAIFGLVKGIWNEAAAALSAAKKDTREAYAPDTYRCQEYVYQDEAARRSVKRKAIQMKGSPLTRSMGMHYQACMEELGLWEPEEVE